MNILDAVFQARRHMRVQEKYQVCGESIILCMYASYRYTWENHTCEEYQQMGNSQLYRSKISSDREYPFIIVYLIEGET